MHLIVCIKQVPSPEAAFSMFRIDAQARKVVPVAGVPLVMSPFDEQAVEAALRIRESVGDSKITAVCVGPDTARNALKHALAMGADEALLMSDPLLDDAGPEATAYALSRLIATIGDADLILTGRQAADTDGGVVGCGVAELLGLPVATFASSVEVDGATARVERVLADGSETVVVDLPAVVTVSNEIGAARSPSLRETMRAARKPLAMRLLTDAGIESDTLAAFAAMRTRERVFVPVKESRCEFIEGDDESAQAQALVERLSEARLM
jgi:electron transfer flavoprotein beta subunit